MKQLVIGSKMNRTELVRENSLYIYTHIDKTYICVCKITVTQTDASGSIFIV